MEKQLQSGGDIPLLAYKKSQTGSTGNIHGLVLVSDQLPSGLSQGLFLNLLNPLKSEILPNKRKFKPDLKLLLKIIAEGASSVSKLSTFMGGLSSKANSNMVQMRRSTNKKGKQAPAPPKRTR